MGPSAQDPLMDKAVRLGVSLDALSALSAYVRVETEDLAAPHEVRELLGAIARELLGDEPDVEARGAAVVGLTRAFLRQAEELVQNPGRAGGWDQVDVPMLQGLGRLSTAIVDGFQVAADELPGLGERLRAGDGAFLDVGTGTGWLALATARAFPSVRVVGIDIFEPALALARQNATDEGLTDRVELRLQDATALEPDACFDAIWLPLPFMPRAVVIDAVRASFAALRPGGWLLPGMFAGPGDRLSELLIELRTVRSGGHPWKPEDLLDLLGEHGFVDCAEVERRWTAPLQLFAGRRP